MLLLAFQPASHDRGTQYFYVLSSDSHSSDLFLENGCFLQNIDTKESHCLFICTTAFVRMTAETTCKTQLQQ